AHVDALLLLEFGDVLHVLVDVALHAAAPPQDAKLRALLRRVVPLRIGILEPDHRSDQRAGGHAGRRLQKFAAFEFTHDFLLLERNATTKFMVSECDPSVYAASDWPLAESNKCARVRSGSNPTRSPGRQLVRSRTSELNSCPLKR